MADTSLTDVCRLCLSKDKLVWVFDKRFENSNSMKRIVFTTTGVEINFTDVVSQKICEICCHIVTQMFEFRKNSLRNDKLVKDKLKKRNRNNCSELEKKQEYSSLIIHPSIQNIYEQNPKICLPDKCVTMDVNPVVQLKMNEVEGYFNRRNMNFKQHCKLTMKKYHNTARKRTRAPIVCPGSPLCTINGRILPNKTSPPKDGTLQPIKIKITQQKRNFNDVVCVNDAKRKPPEIEKIKCHKKRKLSDVESPTKENENPTTVDERIDTSLSCSTYLFKPLFVCNICDSIHSTNAELKKHQQKHTKCQFCKYELASDYDRDTHLKNCLVKDCLNRRPIVAISKVETSLNVVKKYPKTFADFPSLINHLEMEDNAEPFVPQSSTYTTTADVIAIADDNDTPEVIKSNDRLHKKIESPAKRFRKPKVKIRDYAIPKTINSVINEQEKLKELLWWHNTPVEKGAQTQLPDHFRIEIDKETFTAKINNLSLHLENSPVNVEITNGEFDVKCKDNTNQRKSKSFKMWDPLASIDVTANRTKTVNFPVGVEITNGEFDVKCKNNTNETESESCKTCDTLASIDVRENRTKLVNFNRSDTCSQVGPLLTENTFSGDLVNSEPMVSTSTVTTSAITALQCTAPSALEDAIYINAKPRMTSTVLTNDTLILNNTSNVTVTSSLGQNQSNNAESNTSNSNKTAVMSGSKPTESQIPNITILPNGYFVYAKDMTATSLRRTPTTTHNLATSTGVNKSSTNISCFSSCAVVTSSSNTSTFATNTIINSTNTANLHDLNCAGKSVNSQLPNSKVSSTNTNYFFLPNTVVADLQHKNVNFSPSTISTNIPNTITTQLPISSVPVKSYLLPVNLKSFRAPTHPSPSRPQLISSFSERNSKMSYTPQSVSSSTSTVSVTPSQNTFVSLPYASFLQALNTESMGRNGCIRQSSTSLNFPVGQNQNNVPKNVFPQVGKYMYSSKSNNNYNFIDTNSNSASIPAGVNCANDQPVTNSTIYPSPTPLCNEDTQIKFIRVKNMSELI